MSYEAWVIIGLAVNTVMGAVAIWQRHQTIRKLNMDKFPKVHQPRAINAWSDCGKDNRQVPPDKGRFDTLQDFLDGK